jgi:hypothetical protein
MLAATALPSRADTIVSVDLSNITFKGNKTCGGTCQDIFNVTWEFSLYTNFPKTGKYSLSKLYLYCETGPCSTEFATDTYINPSSGTIKVSAVAPSPVPEPSSFSLLACGVLAMAAVAARASARDPRSDCAGDWNCGPRFALQPTR